MKHSEAILAIRYLAAYFPNQKFDEFTIDAWAGALIDYEYEDARDAIRHLATTPLRPGQSFLLELRDLTGHLDHMIHERVTGRRLPTPPSDMSASEYLHWHRTETAKLRKRDWTPPPALEGTPRNLLQLEGLGLDPAEVARMRKAVT